MEMKVKDVFEKSVNFLRDRNIESPRLETELLLASVLKTDRVGIYLKYEAPLTEAEVNSLRELVVRKSKGEPTAYLIREKYFCGRPFEVGPGVLIPRPETELLVEDLLGSLPKENVRRSLNIADLGAGSGCLGISLGLSLPEAFVTLVERAPDAYQYCKKNLEKLIQEQDKARFCIHLGAVEEWEPKVKFDFIVANPPYIDPEDQEVSPLVKKFEPGDALFADNKGLAAIEAWLPVVERILAPQGIVYFEIGYSQGVAVKKLFESRNLFKVVEILPDFNKKDRMIKAVRNG